MSARTLWIAAMVGLFFTAAPRAEVFLNEITIKGAERVELYNSGAGPVDVNGWTIQGSGSWVVVGAPLIPAEGYVVAVTADTTYSPSSPNSPDLITGTFGPCPCGLVSRLPKARRCDPSFRDRSPYRCPPPRP